MKKIKKKFFPRSIFYASGFFILYRSFLLSISSNLIFFVILIFKLLTLLDKNEAICYRLIV
ncbi:MAG: hypothetical protein CSB21_02980 [Deltaproteobacteria bacterium]|nr:MAG: hypothetical protein CSB21_02980 [Deltaproteobacteria bacterium]